MHSEIATHLRLCDISEDAYICISKDLTSDANFIYGEILAHYLKNNYSVILINFSQSSSHYNHVLLKFGVNVRELKEKQTFITIDGLSQVEKLTNLAPSDTEQDTAFKTLFSDLQGTECVKQLYFHVKTVIDKIIGESKQFALFVDDMSALLNLGLSFTAVSLFVQYCRSLCCTERTVPNILLMGCTHDVEDPENNKTVNYLLHLADITIQIEVLKTGYSKDAHGKITLNVRNSEGIYSREKCLFKVSEKGGKLLTLGL